LDCLRCLRANVDDHEPCHVAGALLVMDASLINKKFTRIGARLKVVERSARRLRTSDAKAECCRV